MNLHRFCVVAVLAAQCVYAEEWGAEQWEDMPEPEFHDADALAAFFGDTTNTTESNVTTEAPDGDNTTDVPATPQPPPPVDNTTTPTTQAPNTATPNPTSETYLHLRINEGTCIMDPGYSYYIPLGTNAFQQLGVCLQGVYINSTGQSVSFYYTFNGCDLVARCNADQEGQVVASLLNPADCVMISETHSARVVGMCPESTEIYRVVLQDYVGFAINAFRMVVSEVLPVAMGNVVVLKFGVEKEEDVVQQGWGGGFAVYFQIIDIYQLSIDELVRAMVSSPLSPLNVLYNSTQTLHTLQNATSITVTDKVVVTQVHEESDTPMWVYLVIGLMGFALLALLVSLVYCVFPTASEREDAKVCRFCVKLK